MAINAAIIGCGFIGATGRPGRSILSHAGAYYDHPEICLRAGCDTNERRLEEFGITWEVQNLYVDYRELLAKEKPQVLSVCTPTSSHFEVSCTAIREGVKYILLEKPVTETLAQADRLISLAEEYGTWVAVNYQRAWDKGCQRMIEQLTTGSVGSVKTVHGFYTGGTVHNGTHMFQIVNAVLGRPTAVRGMPDAHGSLVAIIEYPGGVRAIFSGYDDHFYSLHELDFIAEDGRYRLLHGGERIELWEPRKSGLFLGFRVLALSEVMENPGLQGCQSEALSDLLACRDDRKTPRCGLREGREVLEVALAVEKSHRSKGERVVLPLVD